MSKIQERIKQFIDVKNISVREFCRTIGVSPSFLARDAEISSDKLLNIINTFPEISIEWLLTGNEPMLKKANLNLQPDDQDTFRELYDKCFEEVLALKQKLIDKDKQLSDLIKMNLLLLEREKEASGALENTGKEHSAAG
jgi:hypothetical protein